MKRPVNTVVHAGSTLGSFPCAGRVFRGDLHCPLPRQVWHPPQHRKDAGDQVSIPNGIQAVILHEFTAQATPSLRGRAIRARWGRMLAGRTLGPPTQAAAWPVRPGIGGATAHARLGALGAGLGLSAAAARCGPGFAALAAHTRGPPAREAATIAAMPARSAGASVGHAATTAARSGSLGGVGAGGLGAAGPAGGQETDGVLPDLLPPESETGVFPAGFAGCSSPVLPIGSHSAARRRAHHPPPGRPHSGSPRRPLNSARVAGLAQLVEQRFCKAKPAGLLYPQEPAGRGPRVGRSAPAARRAADTRLTPFDTTCGCQWGMGWARFHVPAPRPVHPETGGSTDRPKADGRWHGSDRTSVPPAASPLNRRA